MSTFTMPGFARTAGRAGVRVLASGALAVGLLTTAPSADVHAATPKASTGSHASERTLTKAQRKARAERRHHLKIKRQVGRAVRVARKQKGDPYSYGSAGPSRFDCSGLTYYSYRKAGFGHMPRTSSAQAGFAHHIKRRKMKRGDLMFFTDGGGVYHVGIFAGWNHGRRMVLHAPYSGTNVRTDPVWTNAWFPGTLRNR